MINIIAIFIFLLVMGLSINTVRAAENYNSSKSNTVTSVAKVHEYVGNILLPYGVGGMEINRVNDALDAGITKNNLTVILTDILVNVGSGTASGEGVSDKIQAILLEFDQLGISEEDAQGVSTPGATGAVPSPSEGSIKNILPSKREVFTPGTGDVSPSASEGNIRDILPSKQVEPAPATTPRSFFDRYEEGKVKAIQNLKAVESKEEREDIRKELKVSRQTLQKSVETLRQDLRENAKDLRENFRENIKTTIGHVDHGKTGRIAVAHGKGLRMVNRYRSAIARFDHILGRLESRIEKIEAQGVDVSAVIPLVEEAKNMSVENKVKIEELKAKYESLLTGEKASGFLKLGDVKGEARAIAKELKSEIEKLRGLLDDIKQAAKDYSSSISNTSTL